MTWHCHCDADSIWHFAFNPLKIFHLTLTHPPLFHRHHLLSKLLRVLALVTLTVHSARVHRSSLWPHACRRPWPHRRRSQRRQPRPFPSSTSRDCSTVLPTPAPAPIRAGDRGHAVLAPDAGGTAPGPPSSTPHARQQSYVYSDF